MNNKNSVWPFLTRTPLSRGRKRRRNAAKTTCMCVPLTFTRWAPAAHNSRLLARRTVSWEEAMADNNDFFTAQLHLVSLSRRWRCLSEDQVHCTWRWESELLCFPLKQLMYTMPTSGTQSDYVCDVLKESDPCRGRIWKRQKKSVQSLTIRKNASASK